MSAKSDAFFGDRGVEALKQNAVRGAFAAGVAQAVKIALQFISIAVLARLLSPDDFGMVAMITPVIGFSLLFQDFGLTEALVTAKNLTRAEAAGIFRINLLFSWVIAAFVAALSPLLATFYHEPAVMELTLGFAAQIVIAGATASHLALLMRGMRFNDLAIIEVARATIGLIAAIVVAYMYASPWALVVQPAAGAIVAMAMAWFMTGWRPGGRARISHIRSMLRFGAGMTTFNLSNYISRNADNIMIGWARGGIELGQYDRAYKLLLFPLQQINGPIGAIIVPILSRIVDQPDRYLAAYRRTLQLTMLVTVPGAVFLIVSAPVLIPFLLGNRWALAAQIFMWLGFAGLHQTISNTFGWLFVSQGRTREYAHFGLFSTATCLTAFGIGLQWGALGVAAAYALSGLFVRLPVIIWKVGQSGPVSARAIIRLATPYAAAAAAAAIVWKVSTYVAPVNALGWLIWSGAAVFTGFFPTIAATRTGREAIGEAMAMLPAAGRSAPEDER